MGLGIRVWGLTPSTQASVAGQPPNWAPGGSLVLWGAEMWWAGQEDSLLQRLGNVGALSPGFPAELHAERSLHRDPAPAAEHHARLLAAGLRLRVHLRRHAQPTAPVQLRLGEGPAGRAGWLPAA